MGLCDLGNHSASFLQLIQISFVYVTFIMDSFLDTLLKFQPQSLPSSQDLTSLF